MLFRSVVDCKEFEENGRRFSVAQIEELGFDQFWKQRADVTAALERYRQKEGYFFSALLVTDVGSNGSLLVLAAPDELVKLIDYPLVEEGVFDLPGVVSRKKQLLPFLTHCLKKGAARLGAA